MILRGKLPYAAFIRLMKSVFCGLGASFLPRDIIARLSQQRGERRVRLTDRTSFRGSWLVILTPLIGALVI